MPVLTKPGADNQTQKGNKMKRNNGLIEVSAVGIRFTFFLLLITFYTNFSVGNKANQYNSK